MRQSAKALTFVLLLTLLVALQVATSAEAASLSRQCRKACGDGIAACVAAGGNDDACPNATGRVRDTRITPTVTAGQTYVSVVDGYGGAQGTFSLTVTPPADPVPTTTTTLPGGGACSSPTAIPAPGGTFSGTTSGTSALAGSCGRAGEAPEQVSQWTPPVSATGAGETSAAATTFVTGPH